VYQWLWLHYYSTFVVHLGNDHSSRHLVSILKVKTQQFDAKTDNQEPTLNPTPLKYRKTVNLILASAQLYILEELIENWASQTPISYWLDFHIILPKQHICTGILMQ
jgi:hypothetical protein